MIIPVSQIATRLAWILALALWVPSAAHSETQLPTAIDPSGAWFRPSLDVNEDPELCSALLDTGSRDFFAISRSRTKVEDWTPLLRPVRMTPSQGPLRPLADGEDPRILVRAGPLPADESTVFAEIESQRVYVAKTRQGGCGGTCESASFHASPRPWGFIENPRAEEAYARLGATTLTVPEYIHEWLRTEDGRLFVGYRQRDDAEGREQLVLVKLTQDGSWRETCRVRMHPGNLAAVDNAALSRALASVRALDAAAGRLTGESGNCGTMNALGHLNRRRMQALEESLYMPWTFVAGGVPATDRAATPPTSTVGPNSVYSSGARLQTTASSGQRLSTCFPGTTPSSSAGHVANRDRLPGRFWRTARTARLLFPNQPPRTATAAPRSRYARRFSIASPWRRFGPCL